MNSITTLACNLQRLLTLSHRQTLKKTCKTLLSTSSAVKRFKTVNLKNDSELQRWIEETEQLYGKSVSNLNSRALNKDRTPKYEENLATKQSSMRRQMPVTTTSENNDSETDNSTTDIDTSSFDSIFLFPLFKPTSSQMLTFQPVVNIELPYNLGAQPPPGVTSILKKTMSPENRFYLERWEKQMVKELGWEGFQLLKKETFQRGHDLHHCLEQFLHGAEESVIETPASIMGYWHSLEKVLPDISDVQLIEQDVLHPHLHYKGIVDCVARYKDKLCVIDWKTSKRQKSDIKYTYDNPVQLAAYAGALNFDEKIQAQIEHTLVVIAYEGGEPAHAHLLPRNQCVHYWGDWLQRLHLYRTMQITEHAASLAAVS